MRRRFLTLLRKLALLPVLHGSLSAETGDAPSKAPVVVEGKNGHRFILIPAGEHALGGQKSTRNPPRHVRLAAFGIAEAETTNAQFAAFVAATHYVTDAERTGFGKVAVEGMEEWAWDQVKGAHWRKPMGGRGPGWEEIPNHPVTQISGVDAQAYCQWLGARLPTLEEWEAAARAGTGTLYPWGQEFDPKQANIWNGESHLKNTLEDTFRYTAPVKSFPPNAWGLYDVIGNVFEYCSGLPPDAEAGDEQRLVAGRGGSWWCSAGTCSFYNLVDIGRMDRHGSLSNQGFRVAK
ncbi:formylglycine-generating enzyme family protein [Prosthecobacter sp.]|uniref:formylglycine-generating enzyme family protein n=1 Tax=Prosthecobacter sp. TaxID=1965333 RepID=UPI0037838617